MPTRCATRPRKFQVQHRGRQANGPSTRRAQQADTGHYQVNDGGRDATTRASLRHAGGGRREPTISATSSPTAPPTRARSPGAPGWCRRPGRRFYDEYAATQLAAPFPQARAPADDGARLRRLAGGARRRRGGDARRQPRSGGAGRLHARAEFRASPATRGRRLCVPALGRAVAPAGAAGGRPIRWSRSRRSRASCISSTSSTRWASTSRRRTCHFNDRGACFAPRRCCAGRRRASAVPAAGVQREGQHHHRAGRRHAEDHQDGAGGRAAARHRALAGRQDAVISAPATPTRSRCWTSPR